MVNFNFISLLEGGRTTKGYVPEPEKSKSGITIGTGVDLGQMGETDLERFNLPEPIKLKLRPYLGKIKQDAVRLLHERPLQVSDDEAQEIDKAVKASSLNRVAKRYNSSSETDFDSLPDGVQTVIASVAFQYGDLASQTPNFWRQVTSGDWQGAYKNLRNFGDAYKTRRNKEADLLQESWAESGVNLA